jgi:hypothetical protein
LNILSFSLESEDIKMCRYCGCVDCNLTKQEVLERGAIIEDNARSIMRLETEYSPQTYSFDGFPAYYSLSALIPDGGDEENPHVYLRFIYDEDEDCGNGWETCEIQNPLKWQTENEFLEKLN